MTLRDLVPWHKQRDDAPVPARSSARGSGDLFDELFRSWALAPWALLGAGTPSFAPLLNVSEDGKEFRITVELAGMKRDDVNVSIHDRQLTITGEKRQEEEEKRGDYLRVERSYGSFTRSVALPVAVDESGVTATFKDGVLTVRLPKPEAELGRKIEISGG